MKVADLFNLANDFHKQGKVELAAQMWGECTERDNNFGPAYLNLYNIYRSNNQLPKAKECLEKFLNCPVTGNTLEAIPKIKSELEQIKQQLNPKPQVAEPAK